MIFHAGSSAIIFGMSDEDKPRSFEEALRAIADEVVRGIEKVQQGDLDRRHRPRPTASTPSVPSASWTARATGCARRPTRSTPPTRSPAPASPSRARAEPTAPSWDDPLRARGPGPARHADRGPGPRAGRAGLRSLDRRARHQRALLPRRRPRPERRARTRARAARPRLDRRRRRGHARRARRAAALAGRARLSRAEPGRRTRAQAVGPPAPRLLAARRVVALAARLVLRRGPGASSLLPRGLVLGVAGGIVAPAAGLSSAWPGASSRLPRGLSCPLGRARASRAWPCRLCGCDGPSSSAARRRPSGRRGRRRRRSTSCPWRP